MKRVGLILIRNEHGVHEPEAHRQLAHVLVNDLRRLTDHFGRVRSVDALIQFDSKVGEVGAIEISSKGPVIRNHAVVVLNVEHGYLFRVRIVKVLVFAWSDIQILRSLDSFLVCASCVARLPCGKLGDGWIGRLVSDIATESDAECEVEPQELRLEVLLEDVIR